MENISSNLDKSNIKMCKKCNKASTYYNTEYCLRCNVIIRDEQKNEEIKKNPLLLMQGFPKKFINCELKDLNKKYMKLIENRLEIEKGIYFYEIMDNWKTCLSVIFAKEVIKKFLRPITFINFTEFCFELKGTWNEEKEMFNDYDLIKHLAKQEILIIDDLGAVKKSKYMIHSLYALDLLINIRYENKLITYVTSNLNLEELAKKYSNRIASRLREMCDFVQIDQ